MTRRGDDRPTCDVCGAARPNVVSVREFKANPHLARWIRLVCERCRDRFAQVKP